MLIISLLFLIIRRLLQTDRRILAHQQILLPKKDLTWHGTTSSGAYGLLITEEEHLRISGQQILMLLTDFTSATHPLQAGCMRYRLNITFVMKLGLTMFQTGRYTHSRWKRKAAKE